MRFEYIRKYAEVGEIALYCRALDVSPQGYKKHTQALLKPYKYADLLANIEAIMSEDKYNRTYGKQRVHEKLQLDYDCLYCYNTVAKVMREHGLLQKKKKRKNLTKSDFYAQKSDNLLCRDFTAKAPCEKVVTDITEFRGRDGKIYVSAIFDCFDNTCLGLSIADHMRTELVIDSYAQAALHYDLAGAISHSDRGSQYTSEQFRKQLKKYKIVQSMNSAAGRCHDNAKCESLWARGKEEIMAIYNIKKLSCREIEQIVYTYYTDYWNYRRICSAIGGMPPIIKRMAYYEKLYDSVA